MRSVIFQPARLSLVRPWNLSMISCRVATWSKDPQWLRSRSVNCSCPKPSDIIFPKLEIKKIKDATTCLTFRKRADRFAAVHLEVRQVDQKPEAFRHQKLENKMIQNEVTHCLEAI